MTGRAVCWGFLTQISFLPCFRQTNVTLFDTRSVLRFVQRLPAMLLAFGDGSKETACGSNRSTTDFVAAMLTGSVTGGEIRPLSAVAAVTTPTQTTHMT
jgi:hypothetical protein